MRKRPLNHGPCSIWQAVLHLAGHCTCRVNIQEASVLKQLFDKYAVPIVDFVIEGVDGNELVKKLKLTIPVTNLNLVAQLCRLLGTLLQESGHYSDPNVRALSCKLCETCRDCPRLCWHRALC